MRWAMEIQVDTVGMAYFHDATGEGAECARLDRQGFGPIRYYPSLTLQARWPGLRDGTNRPVWTSGLQDGCIKVLFAG